MTIDQKYRIWIRESSSAPGTEGVMYGPDDDIRLVMTANGEARIEQVTGTYTDRVAEDECATLMWSSRTPDVFGNPAFERDIVQAVRTPSIFEEVENQTLDVLDVGELRFDHNMGGYVVWGRQGRWPLVGSGERTGIDNGNHFKRIGDVYRTPNLLDVNNLPDSYQRTWGK